MGYRSHSYIQRFGSVSGGGIEIVAASSFVSVVGSMLFKI